MIVTPIVTLFTRENFGGLNPSLKVAVSATLALFGGYQLLTSELYAFHPLVGRKSNPTEAGVEPDAGMLYCSTVFSVAKR